MTKFKILLNNVRGYKTKEKMIKRIIDEEEPTCNDGNCGN